METVKAAILSGLRETSAVLTNVHRSVSPRGRTRHPGKNSTALNPQTPKRSSVSVGCNFGRLYGANRGFNSRFAAVLIAIHLSPRKPRRLGRPLHAPLSTPHPTSTMSAVTNSAVFARKSLAGKAIANKRVATKARAAFNVSANAKVDACDKNSVIVSPSILSANFATLGAEVRAPR